MACFVLGLRRAGCLVIAAALLFWGPNLGAEPPSTKTSKSAAARDRLIQSANGWVYVNGQWVHPDGYKFVNNKIFRTTAKAGRAHPEPPGKLARENADKLAPRTKTNSAEDARVAAEKAAEIRRKNLTPRPAPQTGSHL